MTRQVRDSLPRLLLHPLEERPLNDQVVETTARVAISGYAGFATWATLMKQTIYEAAGGLEAFIALAHAWHARCLADPVVSHAFSHGFHPQHTERLAMYWAESLGGPSAYSNSIGNESFVVRLHSGNGKHKEMDERAQVCFASALEDAGLPNDATLRATLKEYFRWATEAMSAYPNSAADVPQRLSVPRWSWEGPIS